MRYSYMLHPLDRFWVVTDGDRGGAIVSVHSSENSAAAAAMRLEQDWRAETFYPRYAATDAA